MSNLHERNPGEESSMEDILSSIRQILASDDTQEEAPKAFEKPSPQVLSHEAMAEPAPSHHTITAEAEPQATHTPSSHHNDVLELTEEVHISEQGAKLISQRTADAASHALSKLNQALHPAHSPAPTQHHIVGGSMTLEALVTHAMQPILKDWMDRNLPQVIERVVTAEIKKLVRQSS